MTKKAAMEDGRQGGVTGGRRFLRTALVLGMIAVPAVGFLAEPANAAPREDLCKDAQNLYTHDQGWLDGAEGRVSEDYQDIAAGDPVGSARLPGDVEDMRQAREALDKERDFIFNNCDDE